MNQSAFAFYLILNSLRSTQYNDILQLLLPKLDIADNALIIDK